MALDPIVFFPSADLNQSCSLSCSFEKLRARPSSSLSCSFENCARDRFVRCLVPSKRALTVALSRFGRGATPNGESVVFHLGLAELSQVV